MSKSKVSKGWQFIAKKTHGIFWVKTSVFSEIREAARLFSISAKSLCFVTIWGRCAPSPWCPEGNVTGRAPVGLKGAHETKPAGPLQTGKKNKQPALTVVLLNYACILCRVHKCVHMEFWSKKLTGKEKLGRLKTQCLLSLNKTNSPGRSLR